MNLENILKNEENIYKSLELCMKKLDLKMDMTNIVREQINELSRRAQQIGVLTYDELQVLTNLEERADRNIS